MSGSDWINVAVLGVMITLIGSSLLLSMRGRLNTALQHAVIWGLIFMATIALIAIFPQIRHSIVPQQQEVQSGRIELPLERDGHYYATLQLNGTPVRFTVDTGASDIVLSRADAQAIGLNLESLAWVGTARTANGTVRLAPVTLDTVQFEGRTSRHIRASVNDAPMDQSLLGMSYLRHFDKIEITGGKLVLHY